MRLISDERKYDRRFQAALAGVELEGGDAGSGGNAAWQQAMRMKRESGRR